MLHTNRLLTPLAETPMPAFNRFSVAERIKVDAMLGTCRIMWISPFFLKHVWDVVEENVPAGVLPSHRLDYGSTNERIINALGGERSNTLGPAAVSLAHFFHVIELGKDGPGRFDGTDNVGFALSAHDGTRRSIQWRGDHEQIRLGASPASHKWEKDVRVFGGKPHD